jgi:hypothetical protein
MMPLRLMGVMSASYVMTADPWSAAAVHDVEGSRILDGSSSSTTGSPVIVSAVESNGRATSTPCRAYSSHPGSANTGVASSEPTSFFDWSLSEPAKISNLPFFPGSAV